jgi:hypothetical protein
MKTRIQTTLTTLALFGLALAACTAQPTAQPTIDLTEAAALVAPTQTAVAVQQTADSLAAQPPASETPTPTREPTNTPEPTLTPTPTITLTPTPIEQSADCTNKAAFVDETVPDESSFSPGQTFTKTWTLKNTGTCIWTPEYKLVYVDGEKMGTTTSQPIGQAVQPDGTVELKIDFTAPGTSGVYQGNWKLETADGKQFGLGANADKLFWVRIKVTETVSELNLGAPAWVDGFGSESGNWQMGADSVLRYERTNSTLRVTALQSVGDVWRTINQGDQANLYLQAKFTTGDACSGKDSYGMLVRSSDQNDDIYDSGYVFSISCDGMYRLYRLDDGTYIGLLNWAASSDIKAGANQTNEIGIWIKGSEIRLYANGAKLAQVGDTGHTTGRMGLVIRSVDTPNFTVTVDDVSLWQLAD